MTYSQLFADVSSAQPNIDLDRYAAAGHVLIAIKATEGTTYVNPYHRGQSLGAGLRHIAVVHYHFARPDLCPWPDKEAQHFLDVALPLAEPHDYLCVDIERAATGGWSHDPAWTRAFDVHVRQHSRFRTVLYANRATLELSDDWLFGDDRRVWEADWSDAPNYAPAGYAMFARQFTDGVIGPGPHALPGIGQCDVSRMADSVFEQVTCYR